jgi:CYTH domain-containing protein
VQAQHKYDRVERERRFLVEKFPPQPITVQSRRITDRYIDHTRLRLRHQADSNGSGIFKLTQKIPLPGRGAQQGLLTTMYLDQEEFRILAKLPAKQLNKTRYSIPPFGVDAFEGSLAGLILAEAEFESAAEADSLIIPPFIVHEVSEDVRFTGGRLADASRKDVEDWLSEYGIKFSGLS